MRRERECVLTQEWTANMPIVFMLAGYCGLGRPLCEISRPLLLTNTYIILCWAATLTSSASLKWILILGSLAMYAFSSSLMFNWGLDFEKVAPKDLPGRGLRPLLSCGLILHFFLYGLVYLASAAGMNFMSVQTAQTSMASSFNLRCGSDRVGPA